MKIIYGDDRNINTAEEAKMAEALLNFARPNEPEDPLRLYQLKQSLENYYAFGETPVLSHYARKVYQYIGNLYDKFTNNNKSDLVHNIR